MTRTFLRRVIVWLFLGFSEWDSELEPVLLLLLPLDELDEEVEWAFVRRLLTTMGAC